MTIENTRNLEIRVAVAITTYNGRNHLRTQLDSILAQDLPSTIDYKVYVADDGSTDGTLEIVERYDDKRLTVLHCSRAGGVIKNVQRLLRTVEADWIFLADQDDIWFSDKVKTFVGFIRDQNLSSSDKILIYSDSVVTFGSKFKDKLSFLKSNKKLYRAPRSISEVYFDCPAQGASMALSRKLVTSLEWSAANIVMHDWWISLHAVHSGKLYMIPRPLFAYRQHETNLVGSVHRSMTEKLGGSCNRQRRQELEAQILQMLEFYRTVDTRIPPGISHLSGKPMILQRLWFLLSVRPSRGSGLRTLALWISIIAGW